MEVDFALPAWLLWTLAVAVGVPLYAVVGAATAGLVYRLEGSVGVMDASYFVPGIAWPLVLPVAVMWPVTKRIALFVATVGSRKKG